MKIRLIAFCAFFALIIIASCKQDPYNSEFQASYNAWLKFKTASQNSYNYSVIGGSFNGYKTETIISVRDGKVIMRFFKATMTSGSPSVTTLVEEWTEEQSTLNTHQKGAPTKTLDDVYTEAKDTWLKKRDNAKTYFEAKNEGMISLAGYVENSCADDCFRGVSIGFISSIRYTH